jgi:sugar phosphate isomerase/epimerase
MPGDGILDLRDLARQLKSTGYCGVLSLELFNRNYWEQDPREVARLGLQKMRDSVE